MQQLTNDHTRQQQAQGLLAAITSVVEDPVLVFGSLPPRGRDLDLLVRSPERDRIARLLQGEGYVSCGSRWASFRDGSGLSVELVPAGTWNLPERELHALYSEARPLKEMAPLVTPAPHHTLLIAARRVARVARLNQKIRDRVGAALAEDPDAWSRAERRARDWRARSGLRLLRAEYERRSSPAARTRARAELVLGALASESGRKRIARSMRRGMLRRRKVVAFSGLDGAGKSFQALSLQKALEDVGVEATVVWPPAGNFLFQMPKPVKRALFGVLDRTARASGARSPSSDGARPVPQQSRIMTQLLAVVVTVAHVASLRRGAPRHPRGGVLIYDRYALDSAVYLRYRWARGRRLRFQCWLVRVLARAPVRSYFLDVAPETAFARKEDFPLENLKARDLLYREERERFTAISVNGERRPEELCSEIAADVWQALSP